MKLRSFISIELSDELRNRLEEVQGELKECRADIRWVKTKNIHLTLKFLGDVDETDIEEISNVIRSACSGYKSFYMEVSGIGVFPNTRSPRVLWAGLNDSKMLSGIYEGIDLGLAHLGFKREKRKFSPHLTLGRFRSSRGKEALMERLFLFREGGIGTISVNSVNLMRSELSPAGARYTKISEVALGRPDIP